MPINSDQLRNRLKKLHADLQQTRSVDDESRGLLASLRSDIEHLLSQPEEEDQTGHRALRERLMIAVEQFEETHPTLVATMRGVTDMLSNIGI